jgi:predicted phage gp36 major capsid-like protein
MPRITPAALLPAVAALVLSGGCTTTVPGTASADSAAAAQGTGDAVAWVDQICGSLLPFVRAAGTPPQPSEAKDPATLIRNISDYLTETEESAGSAITGMEAAGPAPVAGGDEIVAELSTTLESMQASVRDARTRIERVEVDDRQALLREVPAAIASLEALANMPSPMADLQRSPELTRAGQQAAGCQQIAREFGR